MGYRSNPLVQAYTAHIRRGQAGAAGACNLVWLRSFQGSELPMHDWQLPYYEGAKARAEELGYALDAGINAHQMSDAQIDRVLTARGVRGVILPFIDFFFREPYEPSNLTAVSVGESPSERPMHAVTPDYFKDMTTAMDRLIAYGYRRIGFCEHNFNTGLSQGTLWGSYLFNQQRLAKKDRLQPMLGFMSGDRPEAESKARFLQWVEKEKPDAVLVSFNQALGWLREAGKDVPGELALVHMGLGPDVAGWSGVSFSAEQIGAAAVDLVTAHILRNEVGTPSHPKLMRINGCWVDGSTTRKPAGKIRAFLPESQSHPVEWFEQEFWGKG